MCGKLKNSNCFRCAHKGDFPKFGHICRLCCYFTLYRSDTNVRKNFKLNLYFYPICFNAIFWQIKILLKRQVFAQQVTYAIAVNDFVDKHI